MNFKNQTSIFHYNIDLENDTKIYLSNKICEKINAVKYFLPR